MVKEEKVLVQFLVKRPMTLSAVISSLACIIGFYNKNALFIMGVIIIILLFVVAYKGNNSTIVFSLLLSIAVIISLFIQLGKIKDLNYASGNVCHGEYIVIEEPSLIGDYYVTTLEVDKSDMLKKGTKINTLYLNGDISFSQHITADISIESMDNSSYSLIDYSEKIYLKGYADNIKNINKTDFVLKNIKKFRNYIKNRIFQNYDYSESSVMLALVTGDRSYFGDEFYSNLKNAGVTHIMVVSGMHLSVMVSFLLYFVQRFIYNKYLKMLAIFVAVITVLCVCGFTMSILRAGITYILIAISLIFDRPQTPSNTLGAAVTLILLNSPLAIFNVAFQLSVLSTFGILVVALPITNYIKENNLIKLNLLLKLICSVIISLSAAIMTLPVVIYYFGYISNVLIITNIFVCYPSTVALALGIIGLILPPVFSELFFILSDLIIKYINWVINYFGSLPFSTISVPKFAAYPLAALIIAILFGLVACKKHIDMLKLNEINNKRLKEGGKKKNGIKKRTVCK